MYIYEMSHCNISKVLIWNNYCDNLQLVGFPKYTHIDWMFKTLCVTTCQLQCGVETQTQIFRDSRAAIGIIGVYNFTTVASQMSDQLCGWFDIPTSQSPVHLLVTANCMPTTITMINEKHDLKPNLLWSEFVKAMGSNIATNGSANS